MCKTGSNTEVIEFEYLDARKPNFEQPQHSTSCGKIDFPLIQLCSDGLAISYTVLDLHRKCDDHWKKRRKF
jgi:hypothetical protein